MIPAPALSIVIPVLDEAPTITRLLHELAAWRAAGDEVIVVDGGSMDGTSLLAAPLCDRVITAPRGRARQMNAGAAVARGRVLWFVHADSSVPATARAAVLAACTEGDGWGRCNVRIDDHAPVFRVIEAGMNLRSRWTAIATGDQGLFVSRALFFAVGGFRPLALMEDIDLCRALRRRQSPHCLGCVISTSSRRWRQRGIVRTILTMWSLRLAWWLGVPAERLARLYGYR